MVLNVHGSNYSVQTAIYVNQKLHMSNFIAFNNYSVQTAIYANQKLHMSNFIAFNVKLPGPLDK
jgi:hypothetical protein